MSCKNCQSRYIGCHSECLDYKNFKEKRKKIEEGKADFEGYLKDAIWRMQNIRKTN